jgi:hypothetical protein
MPFEKVIEHIFPCSCMDTGSIGNHPVKIENHRINVAFGNCQNSVCIGHQCPPVIVIAFDSVFNNATVIQVAIRFALFA